jgi:CcmD family protein
MKTIFRTAGWARAAAVVVGVVALVAALGPRAAVAQEFVKVEGQVRENIPAAPFLAGAYGFIWLAVLLYVIHLARSLRRLGAELEELRKRVGPKA